MRRTVVSLAVAALVVTAAPAAFAASTLENLQAAYDGESNARAKYLAFAKKADEEGYARVAVLFRAAARAEEIHANNHAAVIAKLDSKPKADLKAAEVKSTAENLKAAIAGESYERDTMYPEFLAQAKKDGNAAAVRTFNLAKTAEAEHAKLYASAADALQTWKAAGGPIYVCPVCGYTTTALPAEKCPASFTAKERFEAVR